MFKELHARGVLVNLHYIPVYRQPYYQNKGFKHGYCPQAERYYAEALSLPMYPSMSEAQQDHVISSLKGVLLE